MSFKAKFLLGIILIYTSIIAFWKIGIIPPLSSITSLSDRIISSSCGILIIPVVFIWARLLTKNIKSALLCTVIFTVQPWFIQELRVVSFPIMMTLLILIAAIGLSIIRNIYIKLLLIGLELPFAYLLLSKLMTGLKIGSSIVNNISRILSFDFFFFKNDSFWWGGVQDAGILLQFFLPFLIMGIFSLPKYFRSNRYLIIWFLAGLLITSLNPLFPEGRFFFTTVPIIILTITEGVKNLFFPFEKRVTQIILLLTIMIFIYNFIDFLHNYTIHYQQRVINDLPKIHEKF